MTEKFVLDVTNMSYLVVAADAANVDSVSDIERYSCKDEGS